MRIGIFGGCFNPPHLMHKNIALNLIKYNYLDKVIFVPTGDEYAKKDLISFENRYDMVKLMLEDNLLISNIGKKYNYTYQVLNYFKNKYPNDTIYFVCGADNIAYLDKWKNYEELLKYKFIVINRNDITFKYDNVIIANIPLSDISSTFLRNEIKSGNDVSEYIDLKVYEYIKSGELYKK